MAEKAKKPRSAKQLANDQRLRDRKKDKLENPNPVEVPTEAPQPRKETVSFPEAPAGQNNEMLEKLVLRLMDEIDELKKTKNPDMTAEAALQYTAQMQGQPVVGRNGIQGKMFRYPIEPDYYPNPVERLYDEPTLSRFNLRENYFFDWEVEGVEYEKYGVTYAEPKFTVRLFRKLYGDDGLPNGRFALINRQIQHEDEVVARAAADKLGLTDSFENFQEMMNEVRFLRIRQWLLDLFKPPQVETHNKQPTQMVIDGKVVEVFDTEALIDGESGVSKAGSINREVRIS